MIHDFKPTDLRYLYDESPHRGKLVWMTMCIWRRDPNVSFGKRARTTHFPLNNKSPGMTASRRGRHANMSQNTALESHKLWKNLQKKSIRVKLKIYFFIKKKKPLFMWVPILLCFVHISLHCCCYNIYFPDTRLIKHVSYLGRIATVYYWLHRYPRAGTFVAHM